MDKATEASEGRSLLAEDRDLAAGVSESLEAAPAGAVAAAE